MQVLAVVQGGTLVQHIPTEVAKALEHLPDIPSNEAQHEVRLAEGSRLSSLVGKGSAWVNSVHHQSVRPGSGAFRVAGQATDGVVEAIEVPEKEFCVGVQWHPEYLVDDLDGAIFRAFVEAAARRSRHRKDR